MSFSFQNQGFNTFLCYEIDVCENMDSLTLGMLTNNKIHGFAPTTFLQSDENRYLKYNVTSKVSIKQFFEGTINKKKLLGVFSSITKACILAEEYMLDINSIVFDLDYIFVNVSTSEVSLICLPIVENNEKVDFRAFFKSILLNNRFDQNENGDYFAKLLNYFSSTDELDFEDFNKLLLSLNGGNESSNAAAAPTGFAPAVNNAGNVATSAVGYSAVNTAPILTPSSINSVPPTMPSPQIPVSAPIAPPPVKKAPESSAPIQNIGMSIPGQVNKPLPEAQAPSDKKKDKEKSSGGMFGFLHKEKKPKQKKSEKAPKNNSKANTYSNIAIPGQVVLPSVKGNESPAPKADPSPAEPSRSFPQGVPAPAKAPQAAVPVASAVNSQPVVQSVPVATPQVTVNVPNSMNSMNGAYMENNMMNFGETTVLSSSAGETTVLSGNMNAMTMMPHLIRSKNNESIVIDKPVFRIGKERSYVDYFVADNTAVSRSHANIITRENRYFIVDTNSTNHTFVDGQMIPSNAEIEIKSGARIRLANEDFEFKLY